MEKTIPFMHKQKTQASCLGFSLFIANLLVLKMIHKIMTQ